MGSLDSIDALMAAENAYGLWRRVNFWRTSATTTAATINCGGVSLRRVGQVVVPTLGGSVTKAYLTRARAFLAGFTMPAGVFFALEYNLGSLAVSSNTFTDGVAMPTKTIRGTSVQTAAALAVALVTAAVTATTPVLTITYTDQGGNTGASAALTLPTNPVLDSAFLIGPHLASGDTGIRDVTSLSRDVGSAGTIAIRGLLPFGLSVLGIASHPSMPDPLVMPQVDWPIESAATIALYLWGTGPRASGAADIITELCAVGEA